MSNKEQIADGTVFIFMSDGQEIAMSLLYVTSSVLSILGSLTIVFKVLSERNRATSYDRLMLGLSCSDIVSSLGWLMTPFLLPKETSPRVWAVGNNATCSFLGFLTQLGFSSVLYNGFLSYYFLATIRHGVKRRDFARKWEPWIHVFVALFAFVTSTVGVGMGFFSEVDIGMGCWVNDYPKGCIDEECISETIAWIYGPLPVFFAIISLIVNNGMVYCHVRSVFKASQAALVGENVNQVIIRQDIQKREVATQGFLYVAAFFFCYWPLGTARGIEAFNTEGVDERKIYWALMSQAGALPLQGLLNMLIYNRPNLKRVRAVYPELSGMAAMRVACLDKHIPRLADLSEHETRALASSSISRKRRSGDEKERFAMISSKPPPVSAKSASKHSLSNFSDLHSIQEEESGDSASVDHPDDGPRFIRSSDASCETRHPNSNDGRGSSASVSVADDYFLQLSSSGDTLLPHNHNSVLSMDTSHVWSKPEINQRKDLSRMQVVTAKMIDSSASISTCSSYISPKPRGIFERIPRIEVPPARGLDGDDKPLSAGI
jgi:hypothetical protein